MSSYAPLHVHTHYSLFDGIATPQEYVDRAVAVGMTSIAITDHGSLSGHREMYRAAKAAGIKPILGVEGYICKDRFDHEEKDKTDLLNLNYNHLIILAKNAQGLENLNKLNELAWTEGFYKKPRMDWSILEKYKEGLVITSGCLSGYLCKAIEADNLAVAKEHIQWAKKTFGDDYYIEVMPHNPAEVNKMLLELADEFGIKPVITPDCHHAHEGQREIQELKLILNSYSNKTVEGANFAGTQEHENLMDKLDYLYGEDRQMSFKDFQIHLLSDEEMRNAMLAQGIDREDMYQASRDIADQIQDYDMPDHLDLLPAQYQDPDGELYSLAIEGLKERDLADKQEYLDRLDEELKIIKDKKFGPYFLVVRNMINWAKKEDIMVGPGRGSAAGSLLCYALGITDIDPIQHGLLFFRFINPERNDFPDIDTDIQDSRREDVKDYLVRQYRHVASIATFLEFKGKGIVRDIARVLNIPLPDVNKVLKLVDDWDEYCNSKSTAEFREKYPEIEYYGEQLRGRIRGTGIHAAGVVTSKEPIFKFAPLETRTSPGNKERIPVVAVDMEEAERIGLIKIDALGLKTLSVIQDTTKIIKERSGNDIDLHEINMEDANVYRMLSDGFTKGVFQCEATPYTNLLVKMGVKNFNELAASNALVRPGAMNTIGKDYIARKHGKQNIDYKHVQMKSFTQDTYGCVLYQEQVMLACTELGGMTMAEADKVRKIIGKKKDAKEFDQFKDQFVKGASRFLRPEVAEELWHDFEAHAGYSFNKSHAVAYSTVSYWTAWLKYYYPIEFMFALLKNESDKDARTEYLIEAKRMGISIKLPHINDSDIDFKIEGKGIRFGLSSIKFISDNIASKYMEARPFNSYKELEEFTFGKGNGVNSRALQALKAIGAATFPDNPRNDEEVKENLYEYLNLPEFNISVPSHYHAFINDIEEYEEKGAFVVMGMVKVIKRGKGWSRVEILDKTGSVGIFDEEQSTIETGKTYIILASDNRIVTAIPADEIKGNTSGLIKILNFRQLPYKDDELYVVSFKSRITKAGKKMASLVLADASRELHSVTVFPTAYSKAYMKIDEGNVYKFSLGKTKDGTTIMEDVFNV
ncbi:DnaE DNA polymerase III, alpha subunit [uncultured Caudovirales phage]|uniref:DNA-directed DNA polymerase n=1 Tax=uncultured Caudovirales phage TaxID=2100421 RepID=A0A6J5TD74_9CAUD|nr:DnaE DNA polymerase III, alpha subunit [uncultured Caudovirales phage]CAB5219340.1 DnaE DNA polymerase III, alpha subunit [uncultured Caudovirales phage]